MKHSTLITLRTFLVLVITLSFLAGMNEPVQAASCTWTGSTSTNWTDPSNWSCGHVPGASDDVVIPVTANDPVYSENLGFDLNAIEIQADATLKIANAYNIVLDAMIWQIDGALWFKPTGTYLDMEINEEYRNGVVNIGSSGDLDLDCQGGALRIYSTFNNAGMVESLASASGIALMGNGVHTGEFADLPSLQLASVDPGAEFVFQSTSALTIKNFSVTSGHAFIYGSYSPWGESTALTIDASIPAHPPSVTINSTSVTMPEYTNINPGTTLAVKSPLAIPRLYLAGNLNNTSSINVTDYFLWSGGRFTGDGTTTVQTNTTSTIRPYLGGSMVAQTLSLASTTNWDEYNITLSSSAAIINNGIFNANATTTMTGEATESFVNNGSFIKKTAGTTTTMDIPFTNNGTVETVAGTLIFQQGMENGEDALIDLGGGTLDPGNELILESGDSLIGSGTLAADLVNGGTVSPGKSPGIITVQGNYTQQTDGVLEIELGGTIAGTSFDQLIVTGTATLNGTLNVTLLPAYTPQAGDTFIIIDHATGTGTFDSINLPSLPGGLELKADFSGDGVTLTVVGRSSFIFLPLILK